MESDLGFIAALEEARQGAKEGGVPIGAALVAADGKTILGRGHNMRVQNGSPILHVKYPGDVTLLSKTKRSANAEMSALENSGRLPASAYEGATMYTTLSPCQMCTGACLLYKIKRVVLGENSTFVGGEEYLKQHGVEIVNLKNTECERLMETFIREKPDLWNEDIGV